MKLDINRNTLVNHAIAISFFLIAFVVLFHPSIFGGKTLARHDIQQWEASAKAIADFRDRTGEEPLWTNSMFSGMPTTLVSTVYTGDLIFPIFRFINFHSPYSLLLISCICFYLLMLSFKVEPLVAAVGAICYSYSSYVLIGLTAGHTSRVAAIAFFPLVVAGINLIFQKKYRWGFIATALGLAIQIKVNHLQITYYLALLLLVFGVYHLIVQIKAKDKSLWTKQIPVLAMSVILAVGCNFGQLWDIADYGKYSTRGKSELNSSSSGLEKDYIFEFSNGIAEPMVLFIPNFFGGASTESLSPKSNLAKELRRNGVPRNQVEQYTNSAPTYWGSQRLSAPYYVGAIAIFLAVLAIMTLEKKKKVWLLIVIGLGIVLSWGDNFSMINYFLFENLPGYNKFRSVTFIILLSIFGISVLASLGLNEVLTSGKISLKSLIYAIGITGGFALLAAIFAGIGRYDAPVDQNLLAQQTPQWFIDALRADRASLLRKDALRTALYVALAGGMVYLILKEKVSKKLGLLVILTLTLLDVLLVDKRYLKTSAFVEEADRSVVKTAADDYILGSTQPGDRVLNILNPFNDAITSYYHNSIGGYHGAKLGRYQELIENTLSPEIQELISRLQSGDRNMGGLEGLNMLNTKYLKFGDSPGQVVTNPNTNGNAWFVQAIETVNSPQEEINALQTIDTKTTAVVDLSKFSQAGNIQITSSNASISLMERDLNKLSYRYSSDGNGVIVFSEVYYPKGWIAEIDGNEVDLMRANYVLRCIEAPAGDHTIEFRYEPQIYASGNQIMLISGILLLLSCVGAIIYPYIPKKA